MKTPDKIKKGLECCSILRTNCSLCPYEATVNGDCLNGLVSDALVYIQQLENHFREVAKKVQQLERERDAAVEDLRTMGEHAPCCKTCFYDGTSEDEDPCKDCYAGYLGNYWQWRGVQEVE